MELDNCFDHETFLEQTCRACSRYFFDEAGAGKAKLYQIFADSCNNADSADKHSAPQPSDDIKEIYEELIIWKLNIRPNDGLPQKICLDCCERFRSVKLFRAECLDTQKILESYFKDFDALLESGSLGRLSPKTDSDQSETRATLAFARFSPKDLIEESAETPERLQRFSPFGSPKFAESPKFNEQGYAEISLGTPPPLFEEIKTDPIDVNTMEYLQTEAELLEREMAAGGTKLETKEQPLNSIKSATTVSNFFRQLNDDEQSSANSSDDEHDDDDEDDSSVADSEVESEEDVGKTAQQTQYAVDYDMDEFDMARRTPRRINPLQCKICLLSFSKRSLFKEHHLHAHPQEKPYTCNMCTSAFKTHFMLTQHKLKHNNPDSLKCALCGKCFRSQLHLQRHAKNFHLTSTYTCHICHKKFENYTQIRFQYHVRQHGEKRFQCQHCEKAFHQKVHLINHQRTHTKERPFHCHICGKTYRQQVVCQEHILTHNNPTPFKCKICQKGFTQRSSLRLHYRTHSNNDTFHCELCGQSFVQRAHLKVHQLSHQVEYSHENPDRVNYILPTLPRTAAPLSIGGYAKKRAAHKN